MQNVDHNIGFWEKRQFFRRKLSRIAENCDHNIDPRLGDISPFGRIIKVKTRFYISTKLELNLTHFCQKK
jgi:hypothetical protein